MPAGRPRIFDSPEQMWDLFEQYKVWAKANPFKVQDFVGKDGQEVWRLKERALSMTGFEVFCYKHGYGKDLKDYFADKYAEFSPICSHIRGEIREDQIGGGMAGIYNPSITQRLNALTEKVEQTVTATAKIEYVPNPGNDPIKED